MYFLYSCVSAAALFLASPWLAWQSVRHGKYRHNLRERLGSLPSTLNASRQPSIWVHAVSVGEVLAARALIPGLRARYPDLPVFVSTTTRTGREVAETRLEGVAGLFYFPLDFAWVVRRVVDRIRPRLFIVVETEIWPHVLRACRRNDVPAVLVNARISDRSFPRYRLVRGLLRRVLSDFSRICAQSERSATRLLEIGAPPDRVVMTGSLKYDALDWSLPDRPLDAHPAWPELQALARRPVFVAASTLRGEDELVLDTFAIVRAHVPDAALILAPRHPERFDEVSELVRRRGHVMARRTTLGAGTPFTANVLVLDTVGDLASLFGFASVVFVGGSLVDRGGHNVLEPALFARAIVVGPSMHNFPDIAEAFLEAGAMVQVESGDAMTREVLALMTNADRRATLGRAARALVEVHRGACHRTLDEIARVCPPTARSARAAATSAAGQERNA